MSQSHNHSKPQNGKKKRKGWFGSKKKKSKHKQTTNDNANPPLHLGMISDESEPDNMQTMPHNHHTHTDTKEEQTQTAENSEINALVDTMVDILTTLKQQCCHSNKANDTHHAMDVERFQKLVDWVDFSNSHLSLLLQAWNHKSFWPFLSTTEATAQMSDNTTMLIRLSNTKPGAITVTRMAKVMKHNKYESVVKHKRYLASHHGFGKIVLTGAWGEREVTWDGLLAHLKQSECCICLEELTKVLRLNCGHHFHKHCIEKHVSHSKKQNGTEYATCPLCRKKIENAELMYEPSLAVYKHIPDMAKSKSFNDLNEGKSVRLSGNDGIQRANTATFLQNNSNERRRTVPQNMHLGNHLGVSGLGGFGDSDDEDDYGNVAQVRAEYNKSKRMQK